MNRKQIFEGFHVAEVTLSLVSVVFVLQHIEDKGIPIWGWGLVPFIAMPILVLLGTWILLRVKPSWGHNCVTISQITRIIGLLLSFDIGEGVFVFLAGIVIYWVVTLFNTHDQRLGVPHWKTRLGLWVFLMAGVLAGFAISLMLATILEMTIGFFIGLVIEAVLVILLREEEYSRLLPPYYIFEQKTAGSHQRPKWRAITSLTLTFLGCAIPYALLIIGRKLPEGLREILPIDTGLGSFFSACLAAILGLSFAILYRAVFSQVPKIIE